VGDTLDVIVARRPELSWRGQVTSGGEIPALPYLKNPIRALCRTEQELAALIASAYAELIRNPSITVRVVERTSRPAILFGAVRTPQRFQLQRDVSLNELLFLSGGVTDRASGDIQVFTPEAISCPDAPPEGEGAETKSPLKVIRLVDLMAGKDGTNPLIHPGDIVTVMVAEPVYLTGGVVSPQGINFREQLTLARAIATVGGLSSNARASEIRIYRRQEKLTEPLIIKADYNAIRNQKQPDIPLKAYDIIEVPQSSFTGGRRTWQSAAQEIITDEKLSGALPLRVIN
jgi:protein involved in polysaccharide export with SLBB domain